MPFFRILQNVFALVQEALRVQGYGRPLRHGNSGGFRPRRGPFVCSGLLCLRLRNGFRFLCRFRYGFRFLYGFLCRLRRSRLNFLDQQVIPVFLLVLLIRKSRCLSRDRRSARGRGQVFQKIRVKPVRAHFAGIEAEHRGRIQLPAVFLHRKRMPDAVNLLTHILLRHMFCIGFRGDLHAGLSSQGHKRQIKVEPGLIALIPVQMEIQLLNLPYAVFTG